MGGVLGTSYAVSAWILVAVTGIFVALRLYVQLNLSNRFRAQRRSMRFLSEGLIIFAWLHFLTQTCLDTYLLRTDFFDQSDGGNAAPGRTLAAPDDESARNQQRVLKIVWTEFLIYLNPMYAVKCHMLLFYWTYLIPPSTPHRKTFRSLQLTTVLVVVCWILEFCLVAFWCLPVSRNWSLDNTFCVPLSNKGVFWFTYASHLATDLMVYFLPIPVLRKVQVANRRKKVLASTAFVFGFLCVVFATAQVITNYWPTVNIATNFMFSHMEQTWAILVPCVPAFKLFLRRWQSERGRSGSTQSVIESVRWSSIFGRVLPARVLDRRMSVQVDRNHDAEKGEPKGGESKGGDSKGGESKGTVMESSAC